MLKGQPRGLCFLPCTLMT